MNTHDLENLVRSAAQGDERAFESLVESYRGPVCAVAYGIIGEWALSEDVAQEAFVAAWQGLPGLRAAQRFPSWLYAITKNLARNVLRKRDRDVLSGAVEVMEKDSSVAPDVMDSSDAVWDSLKALPEQYRLPLILFYREGQSTALVAQNLGISEDCARQRLSRGRHMLKDHVVHLVEDVLSNTGPSARFTLGVMGVISMGTAPVAMAQATTAIVAGKSAVSVAGLPTILMVFLGPLLGMTGGYFGMWAGIRNTPTLAVRRFMIRYCGVGYAFVWFLIGYQGFSGFFLWETPKYMAIASGGMWLLYVPLLVIFVWAGNAGARKIANAELSDAGGPDDPLVVGETLKRSKRWAFSGLYIGIAGSVGISAWLYALPGIPWWSGIVLAAIMHMGYLVLVLAGLRIAKDEVIFQATAPAAYLDWMKPGEPGVKVSPRALFWNDTFALGGSLGGCSAWMVVGCIRAEHYAWAGCGS